MHQLKIGDGNTSFADLPIVGGEDTSEDIQNIKNQLTSFEKTENKTTELSYLSTDDQYPSAKSVMDKIALCGDEIDKRELLSNKTNSISASSTNDQYPSAKAVYTQLNAKQSTASRVYSISSSSTDSTYPSALAVYNAIKDKPDTESGTCTLYQSTSRGDSSGGKITAKYYKVGQLVTIYGRTTESCNCLWNFPFIPATSTSGSIATMYYESSNYIGFGSNSYADNQLLDVYCDVFINKQTGEFKTTEMLAEREYMFPAGAYFKIQFTI